MITLKVFRAHIDITLHLIDNGIGLGIIRDFWKALLSRNKILFCFLVGLQRISPENKYLNIAMLHFFMFIIDHWFSYLLENQYFWDVP